MALGTEQHRGGRVAANRWGRLGSRKLSGLPSTVPCLPVPIPLLSTWAGGYTCCSPAGALVAAGGKRGFSRRCPLRWPLVPTLRFYIARGFSPPSRLTGMSLPFSSHIWVLGTGAPSPGGLAAWAPARVPCADQRRSGLAGAQVKRAWPYMECLPGWWAPPDPAQLPPGGAGVGRGSPPAPGGASAPAPGAAPVRGPPRPGLPCARGLWKVPPHCIPTSGSLLRPPNPLERLQGGGRRVQVVEWWWAGEIEERSHPESWVGQEGDPSPSSPAITSPRYPERPGSGGLTLSVPTPTGEGHRQREGAQLSRGRQLAAGRESGAVGGGAGLPGTGSGRWL